MPSTDRLAEKRILRAIDLTDALCDRLERVIELIEQEHPGPPPELTVVKEPDDA